MLAHALSSNSLSQNEAELFSRIQIELIKKYDIDEKLASEMAWDFLDVLSAVNGDFDIFEKYFLH